MFYTEDPNSQGKDFTKGQPSQRFSSAQELVDVLRQLLRGEPMEVVARDHHVPIARLNHWMQRLLEDDVEGLNLGDGTHDRLRDLNNQMGALNKKIDMIQKIVEGLTNEFEMVASHTTPISEYQDSEYGAQKEETILVVDDEEEILMLVKRVLETQGYRVLTAQHNSQAFLVAFQYSGPIHLMISDVMMPGVSGPEFGAKLCQYRPDMKIMYMSGWPQETVFEKLVSQDGVAFISKPFSAEVLLSTIREVLDTPSGSVKSTNGHGPTA